MTERILLRIGIEGKALAPEILYVIVLISSWKLRAVQDQCLKNCVSRYSGVLELTNHLTVVDGD